jgi:hypothetical protein
MPLASVRLRHEGIEPSANTTAELDWLAAAADRELAAAEQARARRRPAEAATTTITRS